MIKKCIGSCGRELEEDVENFRKRSDNKKFNNKCKLCVKTEACAHYKFRKENPKLKKEIKISENGFKIKKCTGECNRELEETSENFPFKSKTQYFENICRHCVNERTKCWQKENKEKVNNKNKKWKRNNKQKVRATHMKYIAKDPARFKSMSTKSRREWERNNPDKVLKKCHKRRMMLKDAGSHTYQEWFDLCKKYGFCCYYCGNYCGNYCKNLTEDHMLPISKGGSDYIDNIAPACLSCNSSKGDKDVVFWSDDKFKAK